jgi:hypothetical protein
MSLSSREREMELRRRAMESRDEHAAILEAETHQLIEEESKATIQWVEDGLTFSDVSRVPRGSD